MSKSRHIAFLIMFSCIIFLAVLAFMMLFPGIITGKAVAVGMTGFTVISLTVFFVFFGGPENDPEKRVFRTFVSIGIKMLLSFVLALVYFLIFKLREPPLVILFFVLYLGFTLFIVFTFRSILKNRLV